MKIIASLLIFSIAVSCASAALTWNAGAGKLNFPLVPSSACNATSLGKQRTCATGEVCGPTVTTNGTYGLGCRIKKVACEDIHEKGCEIFNTFLDKVKAFSTATCDSSIRKILVPQIKKQVDKIPGAEDVMNEYIDTNVATLCPEECLTCGNSAEGTGTFAGNATADDLAQLRATYCAWSGYVEKDGNEYTSSACNATFTIVGTPTATRERRLSTSSEFKLVQAKPSDGSYPRGMLVNFIEFVNEFTGTENKTEFQFLTKVSAFKINDVEGDDSGLSLLAWVAIVVGVVLLVVCVIPIICCCICCCCCGKKKVDGGDDIEDYDG